MKKIIHKSPIPLYVVAATWILYALFFPLYEISHIMIAVIVTAVVGVIARLLCKDVVEEVKEEPKKVEPKTTGNPELDKMLADGEKAIAEMKRLDDNIQDAVISAQIVRLESVSGRIFAHVEENPEKLPQIRKFMNYYLPTTLKLLNSYDQMSSQGVDGENITGTMNRVEDMMETIVKAFEKQLDSLFGSDAMDISTDITVLENMMAREGLSDDLIHKNAESTKQEETRTEFGDLTDEVFNKVSDFDENAQSGTATASDETSIGDITLKL